MKASVKSVTKAALERRGESIRDLRRRRNEHRNHHFDGGRRPLERKRSKAWLRKRYDEGPPAGRGLAGLIPEDTSASDRLRKMLGLRVEEGGR